MSWLKNEKNSNQKADNEKSQKRLGLACLIVSLLIIIALSVLIYQLIPVISIEITSQSSQPINQPSRPTAISFKASLPIVGKLFEEGSSKTNILALGRPGQGYSGSDLTDTIILAQLLPEEKKLTLISLPRDLLVKLPDRQPSYSVKINSLYSIAGIEALKKKVEEITGLPIDQYILVDLEVVKEIIELVDGLNVFVPQDINDPYFPGSNYTYRPFQLEAGWRYLDGETTLRYIRTRYTSPNGDFDRMARQQQIIRLIKQKVLSLNPLFNFLTYLKIFNSLKSHIETDLTIWQMRSLWKDLQAVDLNQMTTVVIDKRKTDLLVGGLVNFGQQKASLVYPKAGQDNYSEIRKYIREFID